MSPAECEQADESRLTLIPQGLSLVTMIGES